MCDALSNLQTQFSQFKPPQQFGTVMSAGAGLIGGISQIEAGFAGKAAYDYNAKVALEQAQEREAAVGEKFDRLMGKQRSLYAHAGVDIGSGSPLLVLADTARQKGLEESRIRRAGQKQAALDKYYGKISAFSGMMGGVGMFLKGMSGAVMGMQKQPYGSWDSSLDPQYMD